MDDDRRRVDRDGRCPAPGLLEVEKHAQRVLRLLPTATIQRTRDAIQLEVAGHYGVVVLVTPEAIELRLPTVEWTRGAYGPAASSRLWRRCLAAGLSDAQLMRLVRTAQQVRAAEFQLCRFCGKCFPSEHRHGNACHGCAERHLGIVH